RLQPALRSLLDAAAAASEVRTDIAAEDLLNAAASLSMHAHAQGSEHARRMVSLLVDGLLYGAVRRLRSENETRRRPA
ncbi:hypothetical protein ACC687_42310, partial [Rhizobium ruizarguesonis]